MVGHDVRTELEVAPQIGIGRRQDRAGADNDRYGRSTEQPWAGLQRHGLSYAGRDRSRRMQRRTQMTTPRQPRAGFLLGLIVAAAAAVCVYAIRQVDPDLFGYFDYGRLFLVQRT